MTQKQQETLRRLSALRQVSQAAVLRDALDSLVEGDIRLHRIERARVAVGAFRSGVATTSAEHDLALDEAFG